MLLKSLTPTESLEKVYRLQSGNREQIDRFKVNFTTLLNRINEQESEENVKGHLMDFLKEVYYKDAYLIATKGKTDFVIHTGKEANAPAGVLFEVKRPTNKGEMIDSWQLTNGAVQQLITKLRATGQPLGEYVNGKIYRGVLTGLNEAFVIDAATKDKLIEEDARSAEIIKPFLAGRDVKRYQTPKVDKFLLLFRNGITKAMFGKVDEEPAWKQLKNSYPAICQHLEPFKEKTKIRTDKGEYWWELRACAYYDAFEKPKIIYAEIAVSGQFFLDQQGAFCDTTVFLLGNSNQALTALFNSKLWTYLFSKIATDIRGGYLRWKRQFMSQMPIPFINESQNQILETIVNQILTAKAADSNADTTALEAEIDRLVYALYGLTEEEIAIVEGK